MNKEEESKDYKQAIKNIFTDESSNMTASNLHMIFFRRDFYQLIDCRQYFLPNHFSGEAEQDHIIISYSYSYILEEKETNINIIFSIYFLYTKRMANKSKRM